MKHTITVRYEEDRLRASLLCPLCNENWEFPFSAREIFGQPQPSPEIIVALHLYGTGAKQTQCRGFDVGAVIPRIERKDADTVELTLEPIK